MKILTRIKIINWHYFWDELIEIKPIVFLTGVNGSGKSTLIDAIQVVLLGDTSGRYFNKAAMDKSSRTLKGYLRGELGDTIDGGFKYLRNGRFTSYIALEFLDDVKNQPFTMGIVFDSFEDGSEEHHFFCLEAAIPINNFVKDRIPMDYKTLLQFFNENYYQQFTFFDSNRQYQDFLKRKFGGLKDKYFSLLKKATSFTPITDITTFITEYVCDPQANIELDALQDNILQYKKLEVEAANIEKRVHRLEEISNNYAIYKKQKENFVISQYIIEKCQLEQSYAKLRSLNNLVEKNERRIAEIEEELKDFADNLAELESRKTKLISDRASNDTVRIAQNLKDEKRDCEAKIATINENIQIVTSSLSKYINNFQNASKSICDNLSRFELDGIGEDQKDEIEELEDSSKKVLNACSSFKDNFLSDLTKLTKSDLSDFRDVVLIFKNNVSNLASSLAKTIRNLESNIRDIKEQESNIKQGTKTYDSRLTMIKNALEEKLEARFGKHIDVSIFADLIDINDLRWSNAIEGLLYKQKFNLFVAPKYYDDAYKILRELLSQYAFYGTALVDEEKIIEREPRCDEGALAEEIVTDHEGARAYTDFLLGRVHKSKDPIEARNSGNGITMECDLYRNFSMSKLNPRLYQSSYIGRNLDSRFINEKSRQLQASVSNLKIYGDIKDLIDSANRLEIFTTSEIENIFILLKKISDLPGLQKTLDYINDELKNNDSPLAQSLDSRIADIDSDIKSINESRDKVNLEKGNLIQDIENIRKDRIIAEQKTIQEKENSINSHYDPFLVSDQALPIYEKEIAEGKSTLEIFQEFNVEFSRLQYLVNNINNQVIRLRREYCQDYHLSYDTECESNDVYENELIEFRDVKLPEYKEQIKDSYDKATKQFKDDFIFKLRSAIEDVEDQIENLNTALKQSSFGRDLYRFTVKPSIVYRRYYDMLKDDLVINGGKDDTEFINKYKDVMEDLFKQIVDVGDNSKNNQLLDNIQKFTDYRSYLDFDLIVYNKDTGDEQRLSKMIKKKSGGETQTPFYIAVLASFAQLYHVNDEGEMANTMRLIIFDEAFSKMDRGRMTEAIKLLRKFSLQVILSAPYDKIPDISPLVDETLIVLHDKNKSCVRLFEKE